MPLVHITLKKPRPDAERRALADAVHAALVSALGVPADDRFQIVSSAQDDLIYDPGYLGVSRDDDLVVVQVQLSTGRGVAQKQALFRALAAETAKTGLDPRNLFVTLVEIARENWSFGDGIAHYAETVPPHLAAAG
ncbi:tautomerase family protein [Methylobacterium oryzihabitans]|uniref:Tautomerase family protein n=1 Tax=Methylobacterium oryzihabitans TaxID=2499852 RepID=A0A3S2YRV5_9HYPH|nr:tautomerase family protein [Methylobacterium oryzihabitans]RVU18061.1 tautomerase family protein [Methylobacterium oryzihabitans]